MRRREKLHLNLVRGKKKVGAAAVPARSREDKSSSAEATHLPRKRTVIDKNIGAGQKKETTSGMELNEVTWSLIINQQYIFIYIPVSAYTRP